MIPLDFYVTCDAVLSFNRLLSFGAFFITVFFIFLMSLYHKDIIESIVL